MQRLASGRPKALGRLNHANIVTTYDFGFTPKQEPYLVFEYVDGESLQSYLARRGPVPYRECVPIFMQLADAMKYAHTNGVVHRDIKPHNIMIVEKEGKVTAKILDFGIAQMKSETQKLTRAGEIWGSPNYMSPEQCVGDPVDHLTDIYSLGVVMYRTLSGVVPNTGKSFAETVSKKLNQPVPFFGSLELDKPVDIPTGLEEIVIKCLRRYPDERYQSMADLKGALALFAKQENIFDGAASGQFSDEAKAGQVAKTASVTRPVGRPDTSSKTDTVRKPPGSSSSVSSRAGAGAASKKGQNPLSALILPVVALVSVLAVLAMGYFLGKLNEDNDLRVRAAQAASAAKMAKPANIGTPANAVVPFNVPTTLVSPTAPTANTATSVPVIPAASDQADAPAAVPNDTAVPKEPDSPKENTSKESANLKEEAAQKSAAVSAEKNMARKEAAEKKEILRLKKENSEIRALNNEEPGPLTRRLRRRGLAGNGRQDPDQEESDFRGILKHHRRSVFRGGVGAGDNDPPPSYHNHSSTDPNGFYRQFGGTKD